MSDIIFPAGLIVDYTSLNIEEIQYYANMWNIEYTKMENGTFEGSLFGAHTPRIQLATENFSQSFLSRGGFPDGCVLLLYSLSQDLYNFQNALVSTHEIVFLNSGDEIDILTSGTFEVLSMAIEEKFFYEAFYRFFGDMPHSLRESKRFIIKDDMISHFHNVIIHWKNYLTNTLPDLSSKPDYKIIESSILHDLFSSLSFNTPLKMRQKFQTKTIRDLLHESLSANIDINTLIKELNISESQLHYAFKKEYRISPKKYLNNLRLNAIRKELLLTDPQITTVYNIAQKYNFFHMGHFSSLYKKRFGETPSQTFIKNI